MFLKYLWFHQKKMSFLTILVAFTKNMGTFTYSHEIQRLYEKKRSRHGAADIVFGTKSFIFYVTLRLKPYLTKVIVLQLFYVTTEIIQDNPLG